MPLKISHRGYNAKDNSKAALHNAVENGFDILEVDLHKTLDNEIILCHDMFIGTYNVEKTDLYTLKSIDSELLTLDELFTCFPPSKHKLYLDLKGTQIKNSIAKLLIDYVRTHNICPKNIIVASFNLEYLREVMISTLEFTIGFLTVNTFNHLHYHPILNGVHIIIINWFMLSEDTMSILSTFKKPIYVYTCKSNIDYQYIQQFSIDGIISDIVLDF